MRCNIITDTDHFNMKAKRARDIRQVSKFCIYSALHHSRLQLSAVYGNVTWKGWIWMQKKNNKRPVTHSAADQHTSLAWQSLWDSSSIIKRDRPCFIKLPSFKSADSWIDVIDGKQMVRLIMKWVKYYVQFMTLSIINFFYLILYCTLWTR